MNRTAQCIRMLIYLKSKNRVSTRELAEYLQTNPRNIREFRKELETAGYTISEIRGRNGGYSLDDHSLMPVPALDREQVEALYSARDFLESHPEFEHQDLAVQSLNELITMATSTRPYSYTSYLFSDHRPVSSHEREMLETAKKAIEQSHTLIVHYQGRDKEKPAAVKVDPYHLVCIDDSWYLVGWSHTAKSYRNYRFSDYRMLELQDSQEPYRRDENFRFEHYIGTTSAFRGKLVIYHVAVDLQAERLFKEEYWGSNLNLEKEERQWKIYSFAHDNPAQVFCKLFSFGDKIRLLLPEDKRDEFIGCLVSISRMYGDPYHDKEE